VTKDKFSMRLNVQHTLRLTLVLLFGCGAASGLVAAEASPSRPATNAVALAQADLLAARKRSTTETTNNVAAWELGRACFTWGKLLKDPVAQEKIYTEGIAACRRSLALNPQSGPAHYYLGMNIGRVADLKRNLAAFKMVKVVEHAFQQAAALDEKYAHGGPDRNLGLLYQHAPGWPISLGNQKLARKHLERAVKLAPDYPENRLNLAEAYREWRESKLFQQELEAIQTLWPKAKTNFTGVAWEVDWADWELRRGKLLPGSKTKP
jgi:tetratricopeptide (TPR) repeat protein